MSAPDAGRRINDLDWTYDFIYVVPSRFTGRDMYAVCPRSGLSVEEAADPSNQLNQLVSLSGAIGYASEAAAHGQLMT